MKETMDMIKGTYLYILFVEFEFSTNKLDKIQEIEKEILEIQNETKQIEEQIDKFKQKKYQLDVSKNGLTNEFLIVKTTILQFRAIII